MGDKKTQEALFRDGQTHLFIFQKALLAGYSLGLASPMTLLAILAISAIANAVITIVTLNWKKNSLEIIFWRLH